MRIQTLEVENFMPYREPVTLDFTDLSLFAIVGETGSGKSSVVDAICYALYGRIPRIRTENGQRENVISRGAKQFHVALTFDLGGAAYRVVRQGTVTREDVQVFRDGEQLNQLLKKKDADRYIEENLLHMSFDVFTRIIVLPQGQFDRFLKPDTPRARRDILISLLNLDIYERIGKAAGAHASELLGELTGLDHDLAGIDQSTLTDEAMEALGQRIADVNAHAAVLQEQLKARDLALAMLEQKVAKGRQLAQLRAQLDKLHSRAADVDADRTLLATGRALASLQPSLTSWEHLAEQRARLEGERDKEALAVQTAQKAVETAGQTYSDLAERADKAAFAEKLADTAAAITRLSELQPFAARVEELQHKMKASAAKKDELERGIATLTDAIQAMDGRRQTLQRDLAAAQAAATEARDVFDQAQAENAALVVQQDLKPGDRCPVCGHVIDELVAHVEHADYASLKAARDEAHAAAERRQTDLNEHDKKAEADRARLESLTRQVSAMQEEDVADQHEAHELTERLLMDASVAREGREDPVAFLRTRLAHLRGQETSTRTAQQAMMTQLDEARRKEDAARALLSQAENKAAVLAGQYRQAVEQHEALQQELSSQEAAHGFDSIAAMKAALLPSDQLAALQAAVERHDRDIATVSAQVEMLAQELGNAVPSDEDVGTARTLRDETSAATARAQDDLAEARHAKDDLVARRGFLVSRQKRKDEVTALLSTYQQVARDFSSKGMVAFVSGGILEQLLVTANDHLRTLSKGRYELLLDAGDQMLVQDSFSASGPRDVATLSGGETFLASLALALAVKDLLSANVDLDSFFIDEGFGTLDENSVQGVADVLESLRKDGSLVGIITHRADLVERFETVLEVTSKGGSARIARRETA
jgi:exonuclease SbcC